MAQKSQSDIKVKKSRNPITGIINVTGGENTGKTSFAFDTGAEPERTAFIDDDVKGKNVVKQVERTGRKFGYYCNLIRDSKGMREIELHNLGMKILDELDTMKGELDVIIWDTWTRFENTFQPVVHRNPTKFREFYSAMGQIKGAEEWNAAFEYEAKTLDAMTEIAPLIILTSHLKKDASKRDVAESKKPLIQKAVMRVYLRHSPNTPEPTGLLLKRLSKVDLSKGGIRPVNVTHRKMIPFTWDRLLYYWENPVGNTLPSPEEQLNEFEMSILDGILTKDQKDVLHLAVIEAEREREEEIRQQKAIKKITSRVEEEVMRSPFQVLTRAMAEYDMDGAKVAEVIGIEDEDDILDLSEKEVRDAWEKIEKYASNASAKKSTRSNGKSTRK